MAQIIPLRCARDLLSTILDEETISKAYINSRADEVMFLTAVRSQCILKHGALCLSEYTQCTKIHFIID